MSRQALARLLAGRPGSLPRMGILLLVAAAGVAIFTVYPMLWLAWGSVTGPDGGLTLQHYVTAVSNPGPVEAVRNSLVFTAGSLAIALTLALVSAITTTRLETPLSGWVRTLSILAFVNPPWITAMAYAWLLSPQAGTFNRLADALVGVKPFNAFSMPAMIFVAALFLYPYLYLTLTAALESVDSTYEEAALTAGASPLHVLRIITIPVVTPAIVTSVVFSIVMLWESFSIPAILGTPGKVYVFATYLYRLLTTPPPDLGLAAAIAVFFCVTAGLAVWLGLRLARRGHAARFQVIGGKGHRSVRLRIGRARYAVAAFNLGIVALALIVPYMALAALSVSRNVYAGFSLSNLTLQHYGGHLASPIFHAILINTLQAAAVTAVVASVLALLVAFLDLRAPGRLKHMISFAATFPIAVPAVAFVVGVAWAWLRPPLVLYGTIWILVVCQVARFLPLGVQHLRDGLSQVRPELDEAARTCGAGTFTVLRLITVPVIRPVVVATFLLLWMASMRDLITPLFLGTGTPETSTLSQRVFFLWGEGLTGPSAALAIMLVALMAALYGTLRVALRGPRPGTGRAATPSGSLVPGDPAA